MSASLAHDVKAEVEVPCTNPIRQLFQSTIAASPQRRKNASTRGQGRVSRRSSLQPAWGLKMKYGLFLMGILFVAPQSAPANTPAFAHCGTYDSYILLYKSVQKFEELGKLHCGESVSITGQDGDYSQVQTTDGRLGWVPSSDLSITAPPPQPAITFGWTEKAKPQLELDAQPDPAPAQPAAQPTESPVRCAFQRIRAAAHQRECDEDARRAPEPRRHHRENQCVPLRFRYFSSGAASLETFRCFRSDYSGDDARAGCVSCRAA